MKSGTSAKVDAITKATGAQRRCGLLPNYFDHLLTLPASSGEVYVTLRCPSVCPCVGLFRRSTVAATCGVFAAELRREQHISIDIYRRLPSAERAASEAWSEEDRRRLGNS